MRKYVIFLESGRHAIISAEDDMEAAYVAQNEAALMDDYLVDLEPIDYNAQKETLFTEQLESIQEYSRELL